MKKMLLLLLAISLMAAFFAGCDEDVAPEAPAEESAVETSPEEIPVETPENATVDPEDKPSETPEKTETTKPAAPSTKPAEKPATTPEKPAEKPKEEADTPAAKPSAKEYSIKEVHTIIKNTYGEDYRPNVEIPRESLKDLFGINLDDIEEYIAEQPMISANIDTFIAIKAKSGKGEAVASALNTYKNSLLDGAMMYPSNMPKAQAAKVVRHGDYVFLVMLGAAGDMEADEETQLSFAKAQVEKGTNAINNYFTK